MATPTIVAPVIRPFQCKIFTLLSCLCATFIFAGTVRGENAISFNTRRSWGKSGGTGVFGWQFTARSNMLVSALGVYDDPSSYDGGVPDDGFFDPHTIAIWAVANPGNPLTTASLPGGKSGRLINGFRYVDTAPVTLLAGHDYVIAATYLNEDGMTGSYNNPEFDLTVSSAIELGGYRHWNPGSNVVEFPQGYVTGVQYAFGPNFTFTVPPDGTNMIYWQHDDGRVASWRFNGTNFQQSTLLGDHSDASTWRLVGVNDFNQDFEPDVLWHRNNGNVLYARWTGLDQMERQPLARGPLAKSWRLAGFGDFNGDTQKDMLWQNTNGMLKVWYMNELEIPGYSFVADGQPVAPGWRVMGVHDFNGDSNADILSQHDSGIVSITPLYETDPGVTVPVRSGTPARNGWRIAGLSDFNQDGSKDILFRNQDGRLGVWIMQGTDYVRAVPLRRGSPRSAGWRIIGVQ